MRAVAEAARVDALDLAEIPAQRVEVVDHHVEDRPATPVEVAVPAAPDVGIGVDAATRARPRPARSRPRSSNPRMRAYSGKKRTTWPTMKRTPARSQASVIARGIVQGERDRLLAEDVLARRRRLLGQRAVERGRHGEDHGVERRVGQRLGQRRRSPARRVGAASVSARASSRSTIQASVSTGQRPAGSRVHRAHRASPDDGDIRHPCLLACAFSNRSPHTPLWPAV